MDARRRTEAGQHPSALKRILRFEETTNQPLMYRKEFFILSAVAAGLFTLVAGLSLFLERALQSEAHMVVVDTLPGLVNAGEAISRMNDNWQGIRSLPDLPAPAARSNLIAHVLANNTDEMWHEYEKSVFDAHDKQLFDRTLAARQNSRAICLQYFSLINAGKLEEARQFLNAKAEPAFQGYKSNAAALFQLNAEIGARRARHIIALSRWLPWVAGLFFVAVFCFGVIIGLKGAFGSLVFVSGWRERQKKS
jgi:hypothetical protein